MAENNPTKRKLVLFFEDATPARLNRVTENVLEPLLEGYGELNIVLPNPDSSFPCTIFIEMDDECLEDAKKRLDSKVLYNMTIHASVSQPNQLVELFKKV
jgi:hypothetical protein